MARRQISVSCAAALESGSALINGREYSAEPRLKFGTANDRLSSFVAGVIFRSGQREEIDFFEGRFRDRTDSDAAFGEVAFRRDAAFGVTPGVRYEEEQRIRRQRRAFRDRLKPDLPRLLPRATIRQAIMQAASVSPSTHLS